jgi:sugar phosphate isomerase/epimerase
MIGVMNRRSFLISTLAASASLRLRGAADQINSSRVSAITDEVARSPAESIQFAHTFGLQWLSLRNVPAPLGTHSPAYYALEPAAMRQAAAEFKDAGIGIGFLDTPFLKFDLPGTEPLHKKPETSEAREKRSAHAKVLFDNRIADLRQGILASQVFGCSLVRIFTFSRVANPESLFPRIANIIGEMSVIAQKEGVKLLIENEYSQNAGTSAETAQLLKLLPANVGINWDTLNGLELGEKPYPDGYDAVPKDRMWNIHVKGKSLLDYPEHLDWMAILGALEKDNYQGKLELETHIFGAGQVAASHASMKELLRLLKAKAASSES